MSVFRPLLCIVFLLIGNSISALPDSHGFSIESIEYVSQINDQNNRHSFFDVNNIKSESSIQVDASFRPHVVFSKVISEMGFLCMHKNRVALQSIRFSETFDFKLFSLKIIYPYHYFP